MVRSRVLYAFAGAVIALLVGRATPASAEFFGCDDQHSSRRVAYSYNATAPYTSHYAQSRPHVTIYPRRSAQRHCQSWLVKEYRPSGTVIVPRERCWWQ